MVGFKVVSCNFSWHAPIAAPTYAEALAVAKSRGFEARIESADTLVAVWSPLYGTKVYNRALAGSPPALVAMSCSPVGSCRSCKACLATASLKEIA